LLYNGNDNGKLLGTILYQRGEGRNQVKKRYIAVGKQPRSSDISHLREA